jgi:cation-transporting P-type ATPase 13A2
MVFDKTGTLTEDGLQILGMQGMKRSNDFLDFVDSVENLLSQDLVKSIRSNLDDKRVLFNEAMACCHAITYVNNELVGDPLEIKMFENTKWVLDETNKASNFIGHDDLIQAFVRPKEDPGYISSKSQESDNS